MNARALTWLSLSLLLLSNVASAHDTVMPALNYNESVSVTQGPNEEEWTRERLNALVAKNRQDEARIRAILDRKRSASSKNAVAMRAFGEAKKSDAKPPSDTARFQKQYLRERGYPEEEAAKPPKPPPADECKPQKLFIRADSLDNYLYGITPAGKAKGASISYTNDRVAAQQTLGVNGMISYVVLRDLCPETPLVPGAPFVSAYTVAPFVNAQGTFTQPQSKKERSSLTGGIEAQVELARVIFPRQVFTLSPYGQTDFRGLARATGLALFWEPFDADLHIGGYINTQPYFNWYLQLRGELDIRNVSDPGVTNLTKGNYAWIGGTARLNLFWFPLAMELRDYIRDRFSFIASVDWFHDLQSGMDITRYTATAKYKLSPEGNSSLAFEYSRGTDKETLVFAHQYMLKLTYAQ